MTVISLITIGASETWCSPAMVLFSTSVPRGRTARSPVPGRKRNPSLRHHVELFGPPISQLASFGHRTRLISSSLSSCFPSAVTWAPVSRSTCAQRLPSLPSPRTRTSSPGLSCTLLENLKSGGQRLGKHRLFIADVFWHHVEIASPGRKRTPRMRRRRLEFPLRFAFGQ